jgi:hypothetical protein
MSKSKKNYPDPEIIINEDSADALRYVLLVFALSSSSFGSVQIIFLYLLLLNVYIIFLYLLLLNVEIIFLYLFS